MTKRRLLQITRTLPWQSAGGMETHAWELSRALLKRGWEVEVLTSALDGSGRVEVREGIRVHYIDYLPEKRPKARWRWWLRYAAAVDAYVADRALAFDVAHSESLYGHKLFRRLAKNGSVPTVMTLHGTHLLQYREAGRPELVTRLGAWHPRAIAQALFIHRQARQDRQAVLPSARWLVPVSQAIAEHVMRDYGQDPTRIRVIPNGIRRDRGPPPARRPRSRESNDERVILYVGRLVRSKGVHRLIEHLHLHAADRLIIAGEGDDAGRLRELAAALSRPDAVQFTGFVEEERKWELYANADVFALASDSEGQPITILESLAAGTPVYARRPWVPEGLEGLVATGDDVSKGIADAVAMASEVRSARNRIVHDFSWDAIAERYETLFAGAPRR